MKVLVTGAAGFIGSFTARRLIDRGDEVVGIDNLNDYYDVNLKRARLSRLNGRPGFLFRKLDVANRFGIHALFKEHRPDRVVHLAAQVGVRYSLEDPHAYVDANIAGFANILEASRQFPVEHLVYASTSSVYGANTRTPSSEHDSADHPLSLYAATKRSNELMAHVYSHLFSIPTTGLRFFTVYGPWVRPDMALFKFTENILAGKPVDIYNYGRHNRDFTYVDDIVEGVIRTLDRTATPNPQWTGAAPDPATSPAPYRLYNIGNGNAVNLMRYIELIERCLGKKAKKNLLPMQPGDVPDTHAGIDALVEDIEYRPMTSIETGVERFVSWYRDYYDC